MPAVGGKLKVALGVSLVITAFAWYWASQGHSNWPFLFALLIVAAVANFIGASL